MYIDELIKKLQAKRALHGNIKIFIYEDTCEELLRITSVNYDAFCSVCGTLYCEIVTETAPENYFKDKECCS